MAAIEAFPEAQIVGNAKTFSMLLQFFDVDFESRKVEVKEGDTLSISF